MVSRRQALEAGLSAADLRRLVRRREWARVHPGVFVDHTGPLTWQQRAWAAVMYAAPAALCSVSALRAATGPGRRDHDDHAPVHVAVDRTRTVTSPPGVVVHRLHDLASRTQWNLSPPRLRIEEAVLDVAAAARDDFTAVATLADAVQSRLSTAARLQVTLRTRSRIARRGLLVSVLEDIADGTCSALEHAYLTLVERPHHLPAGERQVRDTTRGPRYRDVLYRQQRTVVELDGRLFHERAEQLGRDLERDLDAALLDLHTVRLGWSQTVHTPCATATTLARLLTLRGWTGETVRCRRCGTDDVAFGSPGDPEPTRSA